MYPIMLHLLCEALRQTLYIICNVAFDTLGQGARMQSHHITVLFCRLATGAIGKSL